LGSGLQIQDYNGIGFIFLSLESGDLTPLGMNYKSYKGLTPLNPLLQLEKKGSILYHLPLYL